MRAEQLLRREVRGDLGKQSRSCSQRVGDGEEETS